MTQENEFEKIPLALSPTGEGFRIDDDEKLEWYVRKVMMLQAEMNLVASTARVRVQTLANKLRGLQEHFDPQVLEYLYDAIVNGKVKKGQKSLPTGYGRVGVRTVQATVMLKDTDQFFEYMKENHPEYIEEQTIESVSQEGLAFAKELAPNDDGELWPVRGIQGTEFTPQHDVVQISKISERKGMHSPVGENKEG